MQFQFSAANQALPVATEHAQPDLNMLGVPSELHLMDQILTMGDQTFNQLLQKSADPDSVAKPAEMEHLASTLKISHPPAAST